MSELRVEDVSKVLGGTAVLASVTLRLRQSEMTALAGENGSGKSTLLAIIAGQLAADSGDVYLDGASINSVPPHGRAARGICRLFQESRLWEGMSVADHLALALSNRRSGHAPSHVLVQATGIASLLDFLPEQLSLLDRRRVELCMALHGARYLLCDELGAGLALAEARCLYDVVARAIEQRWLDSALMVEHRQALLDQYCSESAQLEVGRVRPPKIRCSATDPDSFLPSNERYFI